MNVLLPLLIVAIAPDAPIEARYPETAAVFQCNFDESWDKNFDEWPDPWTRRKGPGFPHYVSVKIKKEPWPQGSHCLRIELNGKGAVAYSPPIKVDPLFGYVLEAYVKTEGLAHDRAYLSVTLLDGKRSRLETFYSQKVRQTQGWEKIRLGPISPGSNDARLAVIGLHLQPGAPTEGWSREDLDGAASFGDVWLGRLPRLALETTGHFNLFEPGEEVEVNCVASGFVDLEKTPPVTLELEDVLGRELARIERSPDTQPAQTAPEASPSDVPAEPAVLIGRTTWKPPISGPGFYRVRATMKGHRRLVLRQDLSLAVFDSPQTPRGGEFGWTLPHGDRPLPLPQLNRLIAQAGINWVKYPLWHDRPPADELIEGLITFGERLGEHGIELVGLLSAPPPSQPTGEVQSVSRPAAEVFATDPKVWYPPLEPVMTRLATRVRWWQLGDDHDTSFVDQPNLSGKIAQVKAELDRIGRDVNLGMGWGWLNEPPQAAGGAPPWRFLALSADPPMTHIELATYLDATKGSKLQRWMVVEPLPKESYAVEVRAADLVRRMTAAKIHGAEAVFCPQPFSTQRGLLQDDGTPGELLFTWRTVARTLGGAKYIGSIQLPGESPNQIFSRGDDVVMVVWNDEPTEEVLYLGEDVRQIDLWGHSTTPTQQGDRQVIRAGPLPNFVTGINGPITRWRQDFTIAEDRIPSISNRPHQNSLHLKNHFARGVVGRVVLVTPGAWKVDPPEATFYLADAEQLDKGFEITLPPNATSGRHPIRADVEVDAERSYRFSIYRWIEVGMGDVYLEIVTRLNARGELEVEQRMVNRGDGSVSFRCQLLAPHRRRQTIRVVALDRGRDDKLYRLSDGKELIGKTLWLRAEEIGGPRVLNYRFPAEP